LRDVECDIDVSRVEGEMLKRDLKIMTWRRTTKPKWGIVRGEKKL